MSIKLFITKITNHLFLTYELVVGNRRLILPTMIGLIIALTVISQSSVLIETYRPEIFKEVVFNELDNPYYDDGDITIKTYTSRRNPGQESNFEDFNTLINQSIDQAKYSDYVSDYYWYRRIDNYIWQNNTKAYPEDGMSTKKMPIYISSANAFYTSLEFILSSAGKGRLPGNSSEMVLIRPKWDSTEDWYRPSYYDPFDNITLGTEVNITLTRMRDWLGPNKTVNIVGVLEYTPYFRYYYNQETQDLDNSTLLLGKYFRFTYFGGDYAFVTHPPLLEQIVEDLSDSNYEGNVYTDTQGKISLDKTQFDAYNINSEIDKLQSFIRALEWQFQSAGYGSNINSDILRSMRNYENFIFGLIIILLLLSFPVLCIALYLVVYSFGLIKKQKQEQIGIIKTRGGSWFQILVILLGEMLLSTVLAVILGFLLSTLLVDVVMRSSNYLEFLSPSVPVRITIDMVQGLIVWGLIFALLLNFRSIIRMSRQEITETLEPTETQIPFWKRYYLDVVMFVIGTTTWVILMALIRASYEGYDLYGSGLYIIYMVISLLGLPAPFLMFFGTIMVISRFFPLLMKKISDFLWRIEGGINAFAIRNIVRHKQAANRAVLLITLALSFSILSSSLIYSLDETEHLKQYYNVGADLSIPTGPVLNDTILCTLKQNVSHLTSISGIYSAWSYSSGYFDRDIEFLFVDPDTYAKTAFVDPSFKLSSSLSSLMHEISDNNTIILYKGNLEADLSKPKIGGNITLSFENDTSSDYLTFCIGGTFNYWPTMFPYQWDNPSDNFWIIGSLGMFDRLNQSDYFSTPPDAAYQAKIDSLSNIDVTVETIRNVTGISPASPALDYKDYKEGFGRRFSLSILNSDLIVCIVVAMIGVIMFAFFTYVERGKEIGVERALGMTQLQTAQSFLVEAITILAFGSIIGYFTGVYFVTMFLQMTQLGESIPPIVVTHPTALLIQIILGICITAGIGTIIPAYLATRKDISRVLKVE